MPSFSIDKCDEKTRRVLVLANQEAQRLNHEMIGNGHLMLAFMRADFCEAGTIFRNSGYTLSNIIDSFESIWPKQSVPIAMGQLPIDSDLQEVLDRSVGFAQRLGEREITTIHILFALLMHVDGYSGGLASGVLRNMGASGTDRIRAELLRAYPIDINKFIDTTIDQTIDGKGPSN